MIPKKRRILFVIRGIDLFPYYGSIVYALAKRKYAIRILFDKKWSGGESVKKFSSELREAGYDIECGWAVSRNDFWRSALFYTREILNYRRYLISGKMGTSVYYDRWKEYLPSVCKKMLTYGIVRTIVKSMLFASALQLFEKYAPSGKRIVADIRAYAPSAVICSPVNMRFSSADLEYLKASRRLRVPSIVPVISWDNLTTKGLIHSMPDLLLVWNETQKKDAIRIHVFPSDRIRCIGAPFFDVWFSQLAISLAREQFCSRYGLESAYPIMLYLGSSKTVVDDETRVVKNLKKALQQSSDKRIRNMQIIVRPHLANFEHFHALDASIARVVPEKGDLPSRPEALQLFHDTLFHSVCAVGISTSGMIDAIAAGKPVIAIMPDEYSSTQKIIEHFQHLFQSGAVEPAETFDECAKKILELLNGCDKRKEKRNEFIKNFLRPRGIPAGEAAADEVEKLIT